MRPRHLYVLAVALALAARSAPARPGVPRVLMVTYAAGYQHDAARRPGSGALATAERVVRDLGRRSGAFEVTHVASRTDVERLTITGVRSHRGVLFFTTGDVPFAADVRRAIFQVVEEGGGFIGVHSATDTWHALPPYGALVGAVFDGHPWHQRVRVVVEDATHPATRHLGEAFEIADEIYQFRDWSRENVHVLLRLDPRSVDLGRGKRHDGDYALAWTKRAGRGRVFYTALGHDADVWADERFRNHLLGGITWALGAP